MPDRPHVAFFVPDFEVGGAQRVTVTIANGLASLDVDVDVVSPFVRGAFAREVSDDVRVVDLEFREVDGLGILASVPALRRYLCGYEPDVLFSEMTYANVVAILASAMAQTDTVVVPTEHLTFGSDGSFRATVTNALATQLYRFVDHLVAVSAGVAESVAESTAVDPACVDVLYNPVLVDEIWAQSTEPVEHPWFGSDDYETVVSVGRLASQKDLPLLLHAFEDVVIARPNCRLIIVGSGPQQESLLSLTESMGLDDVVSFPGYVENAYAYMGRSSVFALSSRFEGLPTVLIEALACGCSLVSTDCPHGPDEILEGGRYGRLVPVGDSDALAEAILATLDDSADPKTQRSRAADFSVDAVVSEYIAFIERTIHDGVEPR